jgi:hypothetical protein
MDKKRLQELALEGLQAQKERIELEIRALTRAVGAFASTITSGQAPEKRRKNRSTEQRKAQSTRMKAYWAKRRRKIADQTKGTPKRSRKTSKKSTNLSAPAVARGKNTRS